MQPQYMRVTDLAQRYGVHRVTIWDWSAAGILPAPIKLSSRCTVWLREEIEACDAAKAAARKRAHPKALELPPLNAKQRENIVDVATTPKKARIGTGRDRKRKPGAE